MAFQPKCLQKLKSSRGIRPVGEVFAMHLKDVGYLFGRVIRNDCAVAGITDPRPWPREPGHYLVYIYKDVSDSIERIPSLKRSRLLIPPEIIGGGGWTRGYFFPVRRDTLTTDDVLPTHCFRVDFVQFVGKPPVTYLDEYGNWLDRRSKPCAPWGVGEYGSIEAAVAGALGLPHPELPGRNAIADPERLPVVELTSVCADTDNGECLVVLYLPAGMSIDGRDRIEDSLIAAVEDAKVGNWVGHGTDLKDGTTDIRFAGPDARALLLVIKRVLDQRRRQLPSEWYVTVQIGEDGEDRRVAI